MYVGYIRRAFKKKKGISNYLHSSTYLNFSLCKKHAARDEHKVNILSRIVSAKYTQNGWRRLIASISYKNTLWQNSLSRPTCACPVQSFLHIIQHFLLSWVKMFILPMADSKTDTTCWEKSHPPLHSLFSLPLQNSAVARDVRGKCQKSAFLHHNTDAETLKKKKKKNTQEWFQLWTTTAVVVQRFCWMATFHKVHRPTSWHPTFKYLNMCRQMCSISSILSPACNKNWFQHIFCLVRTTSAAHDSSNLNMMHVPLHSVAGVIISTPHHIMNYFIRNQMPDYREKMSCEMHLTWPYTCFTIFF